MKKATLFTVATVIAAVCFSCSKEKESVISVDPKENQEEVQSPVGHEAIIGLSLGEDTKTTHSVELVDSKTNVKTLWKAGDKILVTFTKAAVEHKEVFELSSGENTANGTFRNGDSALGVGDMYSVTYYSSNDYDKTFSWANQTGSVEDIPEYLTSVADATYPAAPILQSELVHSHFNLKVGEAPGDEGLELANAYFSNTSSAFIVDTENHTGEIKITPASAFSYNDNGESANADFYVSVKLAGDSSGNTMKLDLMNGDHYAGIQGYSLNWNITKTYTTDKVYKLTSVKSGAEKVLAYQSGLVGAANKNSSWWDGENSRYATVSSFYAIPTGKKLTLDFVCYSTKANIWNTWGLVAGENLYTNDDFVLRPSGQVWGNADANAHAFSTTSTLSEDDFKDLFAGATVHMEIERIEADYMYVTAQNTKSSNSITVKYYQPIAKAEGVYFALDGANLVLKQAISGNARTISSIDVVCNAKVTGETDYISTSPEAVNVNVILNDATIIKARRSEYTLSFSGNKMVWQVPNPISNIDNAYTVTYHGNDYVGNITLSKAAYSTPTNLGANDNSTTWWTVFAPDPSSSKGYNVPEGTSLTVGTVVTSTAGAESWDAPAIIIRKTDTDGTEFGVMRIDGYGWKYGQNTSAHLAELGWVLDTTGTIKTNCEGAKVYMTVSNAYLGKASVRYYVIYPDNSTYGAYFDNVEVENNDLNMAITLENCYLTFM